MNVVTREVEISVDLRQVGQFSAGADLKTSSPTADDIWVAADTTELFDPDHLRTDVPAATQGRRGKSRVVARDLKRRSGWNRAARWGVGVLIVLALMQEAVATYYDRQLTEVAQTITGRQDVDVHCGRVWDFMFDLRGSANPGFVYWDSSTANLQLPVCINAARWNGDPLDDDKRLGIMILTHELAHLSGHRNESETECVSMWAAPQTALAFGRSAEEGRQVAHWYANNYNNRMRAEYRAPGCLSGPQPSSTLTR